MLLQFFMPQLGLSTKTGAGLLWLRRFYVSLLCLLWSSSAALCKTPSEKIPNGETREDQQSNHLFPPAVSHALRGLYFANLNKAAASVPHLRLALVHDPGSIYLRSRLIEAWRELEQFNEAENVLREGLLGSPHSTLLRRHLAEDLLRRGEAIPAAEILATLRPYFHGWTNGWELWIKALLSTGQNQEAIRALGDAKRSLSREYESLLSIAFLFEEHGLYATAHELYQELQQKTPQNRVFAEGVIRSLVFQGRIQEALELSSKDKTLRGYRSLIWSGLTSELWYKGKASTRVSPESIKGAGPGSPTEKNGLKSDSLREKSGEELARESLEPFALRYDHFLDLIPPGGLYGGWITACIKAPKQELLRDWREPSCRMEESASDRVHEGFDIRLVPVSSMKAHISMVIASLSPWMSQGHLRQFIAAQLALLEPVGDSDAATWADMELAAAWGESSRWQESWMSRLMTYTDDETIQISKSRILCRLGKASEAEEVLRTSLRNSPHSWRLMQALGLFLISSEPNSAEIPILIRRSLRRDSLGDDFMLARGRLLLYLDDLKRPSEQARSRTRRNVQSAAFWELEGDIYWRLGEKAIARDYYMEGLSRNPAPFVRRRLTLKAQAKHREIAHACLF